MLLQGTKVLSIKIDKQNKSNSEKIGGLLILKLLSTSLKSTILSKVKVHFYCTGKIFNNIYLVSVC